MQIYRSAAFTESRRSSVTSGMNKIWLEQQRGAAASARSCGNKLCSRTGSVKIDLADLLTGVPHKISTTPSRPYRRKYSVKTRTLGLHILLVCSRNHSFASPLVDDREKRSEGGLTGSFPASTGSSPASTAVLRRQLRDLQRLHLSGDNRTGHVM